ncbi:helicase HerA domain-containing protein [Tsukamurella hominis]|uniref:helicase HerA domain-containing protein n=1 Tax=Tsukamurella hominis TaxID=1970232 RepID=UPI0039E9AD62
MDLAQGLDLDVDFFAGRSVGLLGKRGAGKSGTGRVIAEELSAAKIQTVIIDPVGVFWGLRSTADGRGEGLPLPVFGGLHGDVALEPAAGPLMADLAIDEGLSMILDLSAFAGRDQERYFARNFLDRIFRRNRNNLLHLIIDEADLFAPQKPRRDDAPLLAAMENIVRRGRNSGLGITMTSQRSAVLNKDVLSQVDILGAMRVTAPSDRAAIADWVRGQGDVATWSTVSETLPNLAVGEAWWWVPEKDILTRAQVRRARTFDCSPTRDRRNSAAREPKALADVDLAAIKDRIAATVERTAATDPVQLAARIHDLEAEIARLRSAGAAPEMVTVEIPVPTPFIPDEVAATVAQLRAAADQATAALDEVTTTIAGLQQLIDHHTSSAVTAPAPAPRANGVTGQPPTPTHDQPPTTSVSASAPPRTQPQDAPTRAGLPPAKRKILDALAELASFGLTAPSRIQLGLWAGISTKSSGYENNLGALRSAGLLDYPQGGHVTLTDAGAAAAETTVTPTIEALHERIRAHVPPARWRILEQLIPSYPQALTRTELAERAGTTPTSSGYENNLGGLRTLGLLDYPSPGTVAATPLLFLGHAT